MELQVEHFQKQYKEVAKENEALMQKVEGLTKTLRSSGNENESLKISRFLTSGRNSKTVLAKKGGRL